MSLSEKEILNTAKLAKLDISEPETVKKLTNDLNNIMDLVGQISSVETDNIEPMAHSQELGQRTRADEVTEENQRDKLQGLVDSDYKEAGLYLVPKVIEGA